MTRPDDSVRGLNLVDPKRVQSARLARLRETLRLADAQVQTEVEVGEEREPEACAVLRKAGQEQLSKRLYECAEESFLSAIEAGLQADYFCWQAAANLVNCQLFLRRLAEADDTAAQLLTMFAEQPAHPIHYLCATQRGAIAAERYGLSGNTDADDAADALLWAQRAYDWQVDHRGSADGLRAYNLVVALLRLDRRAEALNLYARHRADAGFLTWCWQGDHSADLAELAAAIPPPESVGPL